MSAESSPRQARTVRPAVVAAWLAIYLGFVMLAIGVLHALYQSREPGARLAPVARFPAPRLVTADDGLRDPEIARQRADLERYRWIDPAHGVFQIPIGRAMALVAARGAAAYDPVRAAAPAAKPEPKPSPEPGGKP